MADPIMQVIGRELLEQMANRIEQLESALKLIANGAAPAAGSAKPMAFKEWARSVARAALTTNKGSP